MNKYVLDESTHVGTMRFDFADGNCANRWFHMKDLDKGEIKEVQDYCNSIMFNRYNSLSKIVTYCEGNSYDEQKEFQEETENFVYAVKLIPVYREYNGYIFAFRKQNLQEDIAC